LSNELGYRKGKKVLLQEFFSKAVERVESIKEINNSL